jgi:hypothetical protein
MCGVAEAGLAIAVVSAAMAVDNQQKVAKAQSDTNQKTYDSQMTAYNFNLAKTNNQKITEASDAASRKFDTTIRSQYDLAKARTAGGESGISGLSVEALLSDLSSAAGRANVNTDINYLRRDSTLEVDKMNMWGGAANSINSLKTPMSPDYISAGLKIADAGTTYGQKYKDGKTAFND